MITEMIVNEVRQDTERLDRDEERDQREDAGLVDAFTTPHASSLSPSAPLTLPGRHERTILSFIE
jgi:hypothetical protein